MSSFVEIIRNFDPVHAVEQASKTADIDDLTALRMQAVKSQLLRREANLMGDLSYGSKYPDGVRVLKELGFECIEYYQYLYRLFESEDRKPEHFSAWFHYKYGVLVVLKSYGNLINNVDLYCNWDQTGPDKPRCSGGYIMKYPAYDWMVQKQAAEFEKWNKDSTYRIKEYYHYHGFMPWNKAQSLHLDAREFLKLDFKKFLDNGVFLPIWMQEPPMFTICDLTEKHIIYPKEWSYDQSSVKGDEITKQHIDRWPDEVRLRILPGIRF